MFCKQLHKNATSLTIELVKDILNLMSKNAQKILLDFKDSLNRNSVKLLIILVTLFTLPFATILQKNQPLQYNPPQNNLAVPIAKTAQAAEPQIVIPDGILPVYGVHATTLDNLEDGWTTSILYGTITAVDIFNKSPTYNGSNSIAYTVTAPWDELRLTAPAPFDISQYAYLTFYAQAGSPGQLLGVNMLDASGQPILANPIPMSSYGGMPVTGSWTVYNMPIQVFNLPSTTISGIVFKDLNGGTQNIQPPPAIYIDEINFSVQPGEDIPLPSGGAQISGPTTVPTPVMPYYPDISPWVYIIPAIIIGLAIIFQ